MAGEDRATIQAMLDGVAIRILDELRAQRRPTTLQELYAELVRDAAIKTEPVESIMQPAFPFVDVSTPLDLLQTMITPQNPAVLVRDFKTDKTFIITRSDLIRVL